MTLKVIFERISQKMNFSFSEMKKLRLFNSEGLEIYDEDVIFLQNKDILYISLGQDFKVNTYYSEYQMVKVLGQGGFGQVHLGVHKKTKQKVAIKVTNAGGLENAEDIENIFSESETVKALNHPNIVKIYNFFVIKKTL